MIQLMPGRLYRVKKPLRAFLSKQKDNIGFKIPEGAALLYLKVKRKRKSGSPLYFLYDTKIIMVSYHSYTWESKDWRKNSLEWAYNTHFELILSETGVTNE